MMKRKFMVTLCCLGLATASMMGCSKDTTKGSEMDSSETIVSDPIKVEETETKYKKEIGEFSVQSDDAMVFVRNCISSMDWDSLLNITKEHRIEKLDVLPSYYTGEIFTSIDTYNHEIWQNVYSLLFAYSSIDVARDTISASTPHVYYTFSIAFPNCYDAVTKFVNQYDEKPVLEEVEADFLEYLEEKLLDGTITDYLTPSSYSISYDTKYHWIDGCEIIDVQEYAFNEIARMQELFA